MGGTDEPSNLIKLTPKQHANAHKKLFEKYGKKEDYLAWQGLSGQIGKEEIVYQKCLIAASNGGKIGGPKNKGRKRPEVGIKFKKYWTNRPKSKEQRLKMSKAALGRKHTEQTKQKISEYFSKEYIITNPNGKIFQIKNLNKFAKEHNLNQGNLTKVLAGKVKQHKGYIVRYK